MKRTVVNYARTRLGEVITVRTHSWLQRAFGRKGHTQTFYRPHRGAFWYTTPTSSASVAAFSAYLPHPRTPAGGYESVDWSGCRLADLYGVPGEIRLGQRRSKLR